MKAWNLHIFAHYFRHHKTNDLQWLLIRYSVNLLKGWIPFWKIKVKRVQNEKPYKNVAHNKIQACLKGANVWNCVEAMVKKLVKTLECITLTTFAGVKCQNIHQMWCVIVAIGHVTVVVLYPNSFTAIVFVHSWEIG